MHPLEQSGSSESTTRDTPLLVSVPEAARLLGVGTTFGWALVRSGEMPSIKLGRRVLVPRAVLERLASTYEPDGNDQEPDDTPDVSPGVMHSLTPLPFHQAEHRQPSQP